MSVSKTKHRLTAQEVKDAARGRWREILPSFGFNPRWLDGSPQPCPKCKGTDRFRLIDEDAGAVYCNQCFSEENGDGLAAIQWWTGWDFPRTLNHVANCLGIMAGDAQPRASATPARKDANGSAGNAASPSLASPPPASASAKKNGPAAGETRLHFFESQFKRAFGTSTEEGQAKNTAIIEAFAASKPPITVEAVTAAGDRKSVV